MSEQESQDEYKSEIIGKVLGCEIRVVTTADGKRHFESDCLTKKARDDLASVFAEEAVLRVAPRAVLDDEPVEEPVATES